MDSFDQIKDGLSNTLMIGEKHVEEGRFGETGAGDGGAYNGDHGNSFRGAGPSRLLARSPSDSGRIFGSYHPEICNFVFGDGSVRSLTVTIDGTNLGALATRSSKDLFTIDF